MVVEQLVSPLILGFALTYAMNQRTFAIYDRNYLKVIYSSIVLNITYYFNIHYIIQDKPIPYILFALGSTLSCLFMIYRKRIEEDNNDKEPLKEVAITKEN